jgi:hypothetical protein
MPSWSDLEHYLKRNEWKLVRQSGKDKIYEKTMPDGVIFFVNNKLTGVVFKKYGKVCFPYVLILLGVYIIIKCNTLSLL